MSKEQGVWPSTERALADHERGKRLRSIAKEVDGLREQRPLQELFPEGSPRKRELYALLAIVMERAWHELERRLDDPRAQTERYAFDGKELGVCSREKFEDLLDQRPTFYHVTRKLFEHYRGLFLEILPRQLEEGARAQDPVYARLHDLIRDKVHGVHSAKNVTEEIMAGMGTARRVMMLFIAYTPYIYERSFRKAPTPDEWRTVMHNAEPLLLTLASKEFVRFSSLGKILDVTESEAFRVYGDDEFWSEDAFRVEGAGDELHLALQEEFLDDLSRVVPPPEERIRVGCPALYARTQGKNVIQGLYGAMLRDADVYLLPRYSRLTYPSHRGFSVKI